MTKITTFSKNPYWADSDDMFCNYVVESAEEVQQKLINKGYTLQEGLVHYWFDNSDPDEPCWVHVAPFKITVSKLDDVI